MIDKFEENLAEAVAVIQSGDSIAVGGFGLSGVPLSLIAEVCRRDLADLHIISNGGGQSDGLPEGIGRLVAEGRIGRLTCSYPANPEFFRQYFGGEVELDLVPQGTIAERLRAGGSGVAAFYTPTAVRTVLSDGGFVVRVGVDGRADDVAPPKELRVIDDREYVLEYALKPDFALVKADKADRFGNLRFRLGSRNFNPLCAMAARTTIAEATTVLQEPIHPDDVHLPGIFVHSVVKAST